MFRRFWRRETRPRPSGTSPTNDTLVYASKRGQLQRLVTTILRSFSLQLLSTRRTVSPHLRLRLTSDVITMSWPGEGNVTAYCLQAKHR